MNRLARAFSQVVLAPQRLQVRPVEACALLRRIGQVESSDRADVIDVPRGTVLPRHTGNEQPLQVSQQVINGAPDQSKGGRRLAGACAPQCLRQCGTQPVRDGHSRLRRVAQALVRVGLRASSLRSGLAVALTVAPLHLLYSFGIGPNPRAVRRRGMRPVLSPVFLAVLAYSILVAGFPVTSQREPFISMPRLVGVRDSADPLGIFGSVLSRPLALPRPLSLQLFVCHVAILSEGRAFTA